MTFALTRDAGINALCPARRVNDDRLYAEWVLNVADMLPARDTHYIAADLNSWDAWTAEAANVRAWLARPNSATFALAVPYITIKWTTGTCRCHGLRWGYGDLLPTAAAGGAPRCPLWHAEHTAVPLV